MLFVLTHLSFSQRKYRIPSSSNAVSRSGNVQRLKSPRSAPGLTMRIKPSHLDKNSSADDLERSQQAIDDVRNSFQRRLLASPKESSSTREKGLPSPASSLPPRSINSIASGSISTREKNDGHGNFIASTGLEKVSPHSTSNGAQISPQLMRYARANNNKENGDDPFERQESIQSREPSRSQSTPRSFGTHKSLLSKRSASVGKNQNGYQQTKRSNPQSSRVMRSAERPSPRTPTTTPGRLLPENVGKLTEQQIRQLKRIALKKQIEQMRERNEKRRSVYWLIKYNTTKKLKNTIYFGDDPKSSSISPPSLVVSYAADSVCLWGAAAAAVQCCRCGVDRRNVQHIDSQGHMVCQVLCTVV